MSPTLVRLRADHIMMVTGVILYLGYAAGGVGHSISAFIARLHFSPRRHALHVRRLVALFAVRPPSWFDAGRARPYRCDCGGGRRCDHRACSKYRLDHARHLT